MFKRGSFVLKTGMGVKDSHIVDYRDVYNNKTTFWNFKFPYV